MAAEARDDVGDGRMGRGGEEEGGASAGYSNAAGEAHGGDFAAGGTTQASIFYWFTPRYFHCRNPLAPLFLHVCTVSHG